MLQVLQDARSGETSLVEVPPPLLEPRSVRIRTAASLISAGTERAMIDLARKSLVGKAQARPDLARQVVDKARKEGVARTLRTVFDRLDKPMPLGYSAAGVVEAVGDEVTGFKAGDRVAIAGAGYANHAEVNCVPQNLVALIPDGVSFASASYTTVASIAMQGVRIARPEIGDFVVVIGQGLIGLITTQILVAAGCRVIGVDPDPSKTKLALRFGAEAIANTTDEAVSVVSRITGSRLADHVLITAASKSSGPVELAGEISRRKGRVVVVGAVGMEIPRETYYKKELELKISMSYGPGRYDPKYEEQGIDYPYEYVRWTEQRNMSSILALLAQGKLDFDALTTHRFEFDSAVDAYDLITGGSEPHIGVLLEYNIDKVQSEILTVERRPPAAALDTLSIGFVGAGNYAATHLLPHLAKTEGASLVGLVTATGLNAEQKARKFGFAYCTTDYKRIVEDDSLNTVFIATRHGTHARFTCDALERGKHVFVEKPLAVNPQQLVEVSEAYQRSAATKGVGLMVGLNRRFAPMIVELAETFRGRSPLQLNYRVNSGHIPTSTWLHESDEGGGMLVGEMCHFIDLMVFLTGSRPTSVYGAAMRVHSSDVADTDNVVITVTFADGSVGVLSYNTVGSKSAPKERLEVFGGGDVAMLDDFRTLTMHVGGKRRRSRSANQDKGQEAMLQATVGSFLTKGVAPISFDDLRDVMRVVFGARASILSGNVIDLNDSSVA